MDDEYDAGKVVMRKQREAVGRYKLDYGLVSADLTDVEGRKKVKWSDSTELREKMKEYRRSQLSICLDYHHIAVEEEREREGVKKWRQIKDKLQNPEEVDDASIASIKQDTAETDQPDDDTENDEDHDYIEVLPPDSDSASSDDDDPYCDEALETRLRVIKAKASRHTVFPAYKAAVEIYDQWFETEASSTATQDQKSQLKTYREIVASYEQWDETHEDDVIDESYKSVSLKLLEGKKFGEPPQVVADSLSSVLNDEENVRKHKEVYSTMVDAMVTDLSKQIQTTTL